MRGRFVRSSDFLFFIFTSPRLFGGGNDRAALRGRSLLPLATCTRGHSAGDGSIIEGIPVPTATQVRIPAFEFLKPAYAPLPGEQLSQDVGVTALRKMADLHAIVSVKTPSFQGVLTHIGEVIPVEISISTSLPNI